MQVAAGTRRVDVDGDAVAQESARREMSDEGESKGPLEHQVYRAILVNLAAVSKGNGLDCIGGFPCLEHGVHLM